jgi:hypothetical protein
MIWHELRMQAIAFRHAGLPGPAIEALTQAIALARPTPELTECVGTMLNYLADLYLSQGLLTEAEATIREAMGYRIDMGGDLMILAKVMHQQGRQDEAIQTGRQALGIYKRELGWRSDYVRAVKQLVASFKQPPVPKPSGVEQVGRGAA